MLLHIPRILSPELVKVLMEMGHGDEVVLADGNFPAASHTNRLIRCDGHPIPELLEGILTLLPLDLYVEHPITLMDRVPGDPVETPIWETYRQIIEARTGLRDAIHKIDRFSFYSRAREAYAIIATGEHALYANMILKKGVVA